MKAIPVLPNKYRMAAHKDFYVRETASDALFGPLTFQHAEMYARLMSKENDSGLAEVVTLVGSREGDPAISPAIFVSYIYVRGKCVLGGKTANYHSKKGLPFAY